MENILLYAEKKGIVLSKYSASLLKDSDNWQKIIDDLALEENVFVKPSDIENKISRTKLSKVSKKIEVKQTKFKALAKEREPNFRIMSEYDVTGQSLSEGKVDDFLQLFRSKFELLSSMLRKRHNLSPVKLIDLKSISKNENVDVIGIINKKWKTKNNHIAFEIEDLDKKCVVLIMEKDTELMKKGEHILEDNVVGIKGAKISDDFIIIKEVYWPDLPVRSTKLIDEEIYAGGTGDFHVGSNYFLRKPVEKWIKFLNGDGLNEKQIDRVGKLQYLFINGDNIAGVGVYPGQFDDLEIKDIYKQYEAFEDLMLQIPEYIHVFICPGQHDAVRRAEPQPAIPKEFVPRLHDLKNFHFISSPSWVETEGLKNLVYHGPSIHDLIQSVSFLEMTKPQDGMIELLKKRDLMPKYGGKNPYVPEGKDYMVVKEEPDLVWIGDMHHNGYANYRGATVINGGCWEGQTDFEKKLGHTPTPGIFPMINLKTRQITETYFLRENIQREVALENNAEVK